MVEIAKSIDLKEQLSDNKIDEKEIKQLDDFIKTGKYKEKPIGPVDLLGYGKEGNIKAKAFAQALDKLLNTNTMTKSDLDHLRSFYSPLRDFIRQSSQAILAPSESNFLPDADNWRSLVASIDSKLNAQTQAINTQWLESFSLSTGELSAFDSAFTLLKDSYGKTPDANTKNLLDTFALKQKSLREERLTNTVITKENLPNFLNVVNIYKKDYNRREPIPEQVKTFVDGMANKEIAFYKDQIKESWNKDISFDGYLNLQPLLDDFKKTISTIQDKALLELENTKYEGKYSSKLASCYALIDMKGVTAKPYPKEAQQKIEDILANENRISLGLNFVSALKTYSAEFTNPKDIAFLKTKFEDVIRKTPDSVVNTLMKEICTLTDPQADRVFHNIALKFLKDKATDQDNRITSFASVGTTIRDLAISPNPVSTEDATNKTLKQSFFDNIKAPEVVDIPYKDITAKVLNSLASFKIDNPNIQETIISYPKSATTNWYGILLGACQSKYPNLKNIKIQEVEGTTDISIKTVEKTVTQAPVKIEFSNLDAAVIADNTILQERLSQNPEMKALIENPNYKIISGKFFGSASRSFNTTSAQSNVLDHYKDNKKVSFVDATTVALDKDDRNKDLAIDRASSTFRLFDAMAGKILGPIQVEYAVSGPTREQFLKDNPNATEEDIANEFKKYQNSSVDLVLEKTDFKEQQDSFTTVKTQAKDLALNINNEQTTWSKIIDGGGTAIQTIGGSIGSIFTFGGDGLQHPRHKGGCMCNYN